MNRIKAMLLLAVIITGGQYFRVFGQPTPFDCSEVGMIITIGDQVSTTHFYKFDPTATPAVTHLFDITHTGPSYSTNSAGYNPVDGFIYAFPAISPVNATCYNTLLRIGQNAQVQELSVSLGSGITAASIPGSAFRGGTVDYNGIYYLAPQSNGTTMTNGLYYVDLKVSPLVIHNIPFSGGTAITTTAPMGMPDMVWNPENKKLYGIEVGSAGGGTNDGKLNVITLTYDINGIPTGASLNRPGLAYPTNPQFGVMFISFNAGTGNVGKLFAGQNQTGEFFTYDLTTGVRTDTKANFGGTMNVNDGASCPSMNADVMITKNDLMMAVAQGTPTAYTVIVSNAGPAPATNIHVTDSLPKGIVSDADMHWQLYRKSSPNVVSLFNVGEDHTGILSDKVTIPVGDSLIYKVTITVPLGYPHPTLVNTVMAKPDNFVLDPNLLNNSDYDADYVNPPFLPVNPNVRVKIKK